MSLFGIIIFMGGPLLSLYFYKKSKKVGALMIFLTLNAGIFIGIGSEPARDTPNGSPGYVAVGWLFLAVSIVVGFFFLYEDHYKEQINKELENERKELENERKELRKIEQRKQLAKTLFNTCAKRKISNINSAKNKKALELIAHNLNIEDFAVAKKLYLEGKKLVQEEKIANDNKIICDARNAELNKCEEEKGKTNITGKNKYIGKIMQEMYQYTSMLELSSGVKKSVNRNTTYKAVKHDSAIWGGLADGLAGGVAGISTAINTEIENANAEREAARIRENAKEQLKSINQNERILKKYVFEYDKIIQAMKDRLCDDKNLDEKFGLLELTNFKMNILKTKNIEVTFDINETHPIMLLNAPAILDGSLEVEVIDNLDNIIAKGYYNAPGFDSVNANGAGFKGVGHVSVLCCVNDYNVDYNLVHCRCRVNPINMWIIEK